MNKQGGISVFLPTRMGSERVENKNTRLFAGIDGGLRRLKLKQLLELDCLKKIILSTNDPKSIDIVDRFFSGDDKILVLERPTELARSSTNLEDLVDYVPSVIKSEHILWTHVTSPFITSDMYEKMIDAYFKSLPKYDSLMSVNKVQNFLWSEEEGKVKNVRNNNKLKWPRTQDLDPLYEVNSGAFIFSREGYMKLNDRIGVRPLLWKQNIIEGFDIDWEEDFYLAESLIQAFKYEI